MTMNPAVLLLLASVSGLHERFLKEAPRGWEHLEELSRHAEATGTEIYTATDGTNTIAPRTERIEFKANGDCIRVDYARKGRTGGALVINDEYQFTLEQPADATTWVPRYVGRQPRKIDEIRETIGKHATGHLKAPWFVSDKRMVDWLADPFFEIKEIKESGKFVELHFIYNLPPERLKESAIRSGSISFDPALNWAVVGYDIRIPWESEAQQGVYQSTIDYATDADGRPKLRRVRLKQGRDKSDINWDFVLDKYEFTDVPQNAFRLTAYGLPEPSAPDTGRNLWPIIIGASGLVLILIAMLLYRRARS